jgi:hypothetical protein
MLEVVQDQERMMGPKVCDDPIRYRPAGRLTDIELASDYRSDEVRLTDRGKLDEMNTVGEAIAKVGDHFEGESRFSDAARSGERQQAHIWPTEQGCKRHHLVRPPDQRGQGLRQGRRRTILNDSTQHGMGRGAGGGDEHGTVLGTEAEAVSQHAHCLQARR